MIYVMPSNIYDVTLPQLRYFDFETRNDSGIRERERERERDKPQTIRVNGIYIHVQSLPISIQTSFGCDFITRIYYWQRQSLDKPSNDDDDAYYLSNFELHRAIMSIHQFYLSEFTRNS